MAHLPPIQSRRSPKQEAGAALLVTALVLMVVSLLGFAAIRNSEQESTASARSRATTRSLYAADAGVQLAMARLSQNPPQLTAFSVNLADGMTLESRARSETNPVPLDQVNQAVGGKEGFSVNVGAGAKYVSRVFQVNVTSTGGGSTAEVEARLNRIGPEGTGY
jgi:Tfp pilus assembly protein PilX